MQQSNGKADLQRVAWCFPTGCSLNIVVKLHQAENYQQGTIGHLRYSQPQCRVAPCAPPAQLPQTNANHSPTIYQPKFLQHFPLLAQLSSQIDRKNRIG
ncbi:hypothetical protein Nepgr_002406 [Nepenthes gracilis]|uniref:Uncharacterized protein n=1 Tax=Nepenthes gracilis TaxID=150966 RepID=A0AAD3P6Z5_NEPGR|nr:hypothetical protein Nepgr_002406 [Nepenthes gracilis]